MSQHPDSRHLLQHKAETLTESEAAEVLEYIQIMRSLSKEAICPSKNDEALLNLLSVALKVSTEKTDSGLIPHPGNSRFLRPQ
ncbi:MAG TPA: hypothetical protein VNO70_05240 [Blastocatellia bacterium]|nr:hypothetical protein [Blastocatellia bacterium]